MNTGSNSAARPKVSVVIPVYNVEHYIEKCILALQGQTLKDLEFIFIDDCGPDQSVAIIERAAAEDSRIHILYNEQNMGAGKSRNRGIDAARGEYVAFADPDDWMDDNFYEVLYNRAVKGNYDIVKAKRVRVVCRENGAVRYQTSPVNGRIIRGMSAGDPLYQRFTSEHQTAIFRTSMINKHHVYNGSTSHSENSVFLLKACCLCKRFCLESNVAYYYLQREDSSVHVFNKAKFEDELISFGEQLDVMAELKLKRDRYYYTFLKDKIAFLSKRYDELRKIPELRSYRRQYVEELCDQIDRIKDKERVIQGAPKNYLLVNRNVDAYMLIFRFNRQITWLRGCESRMKGKIESVRDKTKKRLKKTRLYKYYKHNKSPVVEFGDRFRDRDIVYIQNFRGCIMFCKKFLEVDPAFAKSYINGFLQNNESYNCNLTSDNPLYQEHLEKAAHGELCWRCVKRFGSVSKTTVYLDDNNTLCFRGEILGSTEEIDTTSFIIHPQKERPIIKGMELREYIASRRSYDEMLAEVRQYLDFLFETFKTQDQTKLHGLSFDAFPYNCIIQDGHKYELFDLEFEYKGELDKGYIIYKTARTLPKECQKSIYYVLCEHYGVVANWEQWETFNFRIWLETIFDSEEELTQENATIFKKYFIA